MDDAYIGGSRPGTCGRGAAGKTPFLAAVSTTSDGKPDQIVLRRVARFSKTAIARFAGATLDAGVHAVSDAFRSCQSARKRDPGPACKKDPGRASFCSVQRCHPSVPAHASDEPARGTAVKNGRFISGRPQGLFLRAVSTAA